MGVGSEFRVFRLLSRIREKRPAHILTLISAPARATLLEAY